ncbi:hypothetical protein AKJ52_00215 [candidate division MSBL1 archaeon SCGC-AAA382C18]|uniref:(5-formylfuran-3-yl)methyl phosphate synthase n=1 Tax=candidate division MSBL1 archaeon SCGC-AAA382C18 TaxID=1698281 RepID=A0A133VLS8_9EURY|nr:hypothetical protein AKJ52_00215 [candidate division MSBL1 archaeon SCGC-AAA382C18]
MTKLLVSPKNVEEARIASKVNVDIIDVKNPKEGSLGANFPWVISQIREIVPSEILISAAIGDFPNLPGSASLAASGAHNAGADIIKVGLKGPKESNDAINLMEKVVKSINRNSETGQVVACGYGDFERADTIDIEKLPVIGKEAGVDYVMIDTAIKDGKPVTEFLTLEQLENFVNKAHSLDLKAALAGSLGREEISQLKKLEPDVIGVRGAVCREKDRTKGMSEELIRDLRNILED